MNAKEAKELSNQNNLISGFIQEISIISKIKEACLKGEYYIDIYENISVNTLNTFLDMGYVITKTKFGNTTHFKIEWTE